MYNSTHILKVLFIILMFSLCSVTAKAQDSQEPVDVQLEAFILRFVSERISWTSNERHIEVGNLFIRVFNERHRLLDNSNVGRFDLQTYFRGQALDLLNEIFHDGNFLSDSQDAHSHTFQLMVTYMTLAVVTPNWGSRFLNTAQSMVAGGWLDFPTQYMVAVFLEVLLDLERAQQRFPRAMAMRNAAMRAGARLQELNEHFANILESGNHDGVVHETVIQFIEGMIRQLAQGV